MPSLSFNNKCFTRYTQNGVYEPYSVFYATNTSQNQGATWRYHTLKIMQGTQPSDFAGMTSTSDLSSDVLVTFTAGMANLCFLAISNNSKASLAFNTPAIVLVFRPQM